MFTYEIKINEKNRGWTTLGNCVRPFTYGTTLDDTLDSGKINVKCATYSKVIKPFTLLSIAIYEDNVLQDTVYCLVANAEREMVRRDATPLYNHNIEVVELSKLLERDVCDTMTVTNYLGHDYPQSTQISFPQWGGQAENFFTPAQTYTTPQLKGTTFTVYSPRAMFNGGLDGATVNQVGVVVTSPSGAKLIDYSPQRGGAVDGTYTDAQKYVFDSGQATQFANTVSPEFFFTRGTLWEALATVGGYIHGIPRLVYDDGVLTVIRRRSCLPQ